MQQKLPVQFDERNLETGLQTLFITPEHNITPPEYIT